MNRSKLAMSLIRTVLAAALIAGAAGGCRSSARDEYMATRNIRIAPTVAGQEPEGIADASDEATEIQRR